MALSLQLGYPDIPKSITNPNVNRVDVVDFEDPMSFIYFIKIISVSFEPDSLQEYYNHYIKLWNIEKNNKPSDEKALIIERYRDFIKELSLNYTTPEEKKYLSKVDFNDPFDLDIVLKFYSKKLLELSRYYNNKRNDLRYSQIRNKLGGTNFGTTKTISELTLSYLKNVSGGKIIYDYDSILSKLEIELEELYDSYSFYYNQTPNEKDYDKKDLDYGLDIFLKGNSEIIENVFSDLSDQLIELKEIENLLDNKRDLTKKYVSTDFYYLSTGSNVQDFLSGKLFDCDNAVLNFLNREFPTTASTPQTSYLKSPRYSGFFTPSKLGVVLVDGSNSSYSINLSNLTPNTVYYFPDPNVCGENGGVLSFTVDESFLKKNYSSGNAVNKPRSSSNDTKYNGYVSKIDQNKSKYLENIFDYGYISDLKYDIYGNLFGLFKNPGKFVKTVEYKDSQITYNVLLNGYTFFDHLYNEGFSFNYLPESTYDETTYRETIRTGLSTNTSTILGRGDVEITFFGGFFTPYDELIEPTESTTIYQIYDNAYILNGYGNPLTDTVSSDLSSFENGYGSHYYTTLLEGGIADDSPLQRALLDNTTPYIESLSATFVNYPKLSNINSIDGGYNINYDFDIYLTPRSYILLPETITPTKILEFNDLSSQSLTGQLMVKNHKTKSCDTLTNSFTYFETKYPYDVFDQLNGRIVNFEIVNDILLIETPNYFTIDKITVGEQGIMDSKTETIILNHSNGNFDKLSNRYKIDNHVYYCKLTTSTDAISSNDFIIYPEIWEFDIINFKNKKIFPPTAYDTSNFFSVSGGNIRAYDCDAPRLTYNSRNNLYNLSFLLKDQNDYPRLHSYTFEIAQNVNFVNHTLTILSNEAISNNMEDLSTLQIFLSSNITAPTSEELII